MSWLSEFIEGVEKAVRDPATLITATIYALSGNYVMAATTIASAGAQNALAARQDPPDYSSYTSEGQNRTQMVKQPIVPRRFVYGETRISGVLGHIESTDNDKRLHLLILVASHEIDSFQTVYLNDEALTLDVDGEVTSPSKYAGKVRIKMHEGSSTQAADSDLVSESAVWTNDHRLQGIAYIYVRLIFDNKIFPAGIPNFSAKVRGKKLYDPRTTTTAYSANPALAIRDYLTNATYGFAASASEIDDVKFAAAANICDETVTLDSGGSESRYEIHGTFTTGNAPKRILQEMVTSCGGVISYVNGKFNLKAADYTAPTITLDENDIISEISLQTKRSKRDNYNAVKGVFSPPETNYIPTDYPALTSSTFETEDGGIRRFLDYDLPYTTSSPMAQRIAKIALFRNRQQITMQMNCSMKAFDLSVGDTVQINNDKLGFSSKIFEVSEWTSSIGSDSGGQPVMNVSLLMRETNSAVYDWDADEKAFTLDNTNLPDVFDITAPTLAISDDLQSYNQQAISVLIANVTATSAFHEQFEVEAKLSTDTDYTSLGIGYGTKFTLVNVQAGSVYDVRARSISRLGVQSDFVENTHTITGSAVDPSDVTGFTVNIVGQQADLKWTAIPDGDLSHYIIRHSPLTTGATFNNSRTLVKKIARPANTITVPALTGTYSIKAVDKFGKVSQNENSSVALVSSIQGFNFADSVSEHTAFSGSKTNVIVIDDKLQLDTSVSFDSVSGNFDDAVGLFDGGGGAVAASGTYDFANSIDLGAVYTGQASATMKLAQLSQHTGTPASATTDVDLYVSSTQDDPSGTPTWTAYRPFVVGSYTARGFRFRAELETTDSFETPAIEELTAEIKLPTRTESDNDIQSGAGAKVIAFTTPFKTLLAVSISVGDMQSGDYYGITSKSATGFTITFYNSSDVAVDRLFDYVATGF